MLEVAIAGYHFKAEKEKHKRNPCDYGRWGVLFFLWYNRQLS